MIRTFRELKNLKTFDDRYKYLKLKSIVGEDSFGYDRYLNQAFYTSKRWRSVRDEVIIRDCGCDLGIDGYKIYDKILIHHMNPINVNDIIHDDIEYSTMYDPEFLICTTFDTHNAIHFGNDSLISKIPIERKKNDTCPWRY